MEHLLPEVMEQHRDAGRLVLALRVPAELAYFSGHFPGFPILPGVVQMDWAIRLAALHLRWQGEFVVAENLRFQSLILPDARPTLVLSPDTARMRLEFTFASGDKKHSSGTLVFR